MSLSTVYHLLRLQLISVALSLTVSAILVLTCQLQLGWVTDGSSLGVGSHAQVGPGILNLYVGHVEDGGPAQPLGGGELGSVVGPGEVWGGLTASGTCECRSETSRR